MAKRKKVKAIKDGWIIGTYKSVSQASKDLGVNRSHIIEVCRGERKSTGGFEFEYVENIYKERR